MKCIRKIVSMVLLLTLILTLAACRPNKQLPGFQDGKKNVVFFVYDNETLYEELATEFESQPGNEDINIIIQKAADSYYEELSTSYVGSQTPDIIFMKTSEIMPFLTTNRILALDEYIEKSELIEWSDLWPINDCYRYNSETGEMGDPDAPLYGLIKDFSPDWTLVYNKELFTTAANAMSDKQMAATILEKLERSANYPEDMTGEDPLDYTLTWSEYYALSLQVKNSCGVNGTILDASPEMQIMQWIQMNGEYLFTEDDKQCKSITGTPGILAAFEMFRKLQDGASSPAGWSNTTAGGPILLNQGKVASTCNGRWAFNEYGWIENLDTFGYMSSPLPDNFNDLPATEYTLTSAIINTTSVGAIHQTAGVAYVASKAALWAATKNTAFMYMEQGIRCNAIAPGGVVTDIPLVMPPSDPFGFERTSSLLVHSPELGMPEDIAAAALFLASDESHFVNGTVITCDGGWTNF